MWCGLTSAGYWTHLVAGYARAPAAMDTPEPTLLSLPKGFLRQLLDVLLKDGAPESVTALFQTCKTLKQLVLDNTCLLLDVDVSSPYAAEEGAFELAAACKKAGGVHLMLAGAEDAPWADECAQMVLCGGTAEYGGPLNPLRKVTLEVRGATLRISHTSHSYAATWNIQWSALVRFASFSQLYKLRVRVCAFCLRSLCRPTTCTRPFPLTSPPSALVLPTLPSQTASTHPETPFPGTHTRTTLTTTET